jgi:hypothetical protein
MATTTTRTNTTATDYPDAPASDIGSESRDVGRAVLEAAGVDNNSVRRLTDESRRLVRERPALAIAGAAVVGLVLGRLWKLRLLRIVLPIAAFAAGFFAERFVGQSDDRVPAT